MTSPSIDVVLATYNGARYLRSQIDSILAQDGVSLRIIIRDDGSQDGTPEIIGQYSRSNPEQVVRLSDSGNLGVAGNFARLLEASTAPYVALADQDDLWFPHKLRTLRAAVRNLEDRHGIRAPVLVHSDLTVVDESLRELHPSFWRYSGLTPAESAVSGLLVKNSVTGCASMMNRALIECALPIPPAALLHDHWLALVAAFSGHLGAVGEALMAYRQHPGNTIGARPYHWKSIARLAPTVQHWDIGALRLQAAVLADRCRANITANNRRMIAEFVSLPERNWIDRRRVLLRHGILMPGILRNVALLTCVRLDR